ncbi:PIN domain nuclease [Chloroflexi bacterium TSY]|nr:PIN domain nuclease [Chloroflexi bacterium TSY]
MRLGPIFRVLGTLVYGFIGWELGVALAQTRELTPDSMRIILSSALIGALLGFLLAPWLVIAPARAARNSLRQVPIEDLVTGSVGLIGGLIIAALLVVPVARLPTPFGTILPFIGAIIFGYLGTAVMVLRKNDLISLLRGNPREMMTNIEPSRLLLLDTSVIIDGRIADIAATGFLLARMAVPRFVLNELQHIADSSDVLRRNRGRRGLEMLDRLQHAPDIDIEFIDRDVGDSTQVDDKLINLALEIDAAVVTNDYNLNRVARLQGVKILNVNELANAVKSVFLPGEEIPLKIIQEGKEAGQGVGYLEDGTMVVVENGRRYVNQEVLVQVTKILQTNAGRLIFATPDIGV